MLNRGLTSLSHRGLPLFPVWLTSTTTASHCPLPRRSLLTMKTFASSASSKQNEQPSSLSLSTPVIPHVAVIGGGIAGLSAFSKLKKMEIPATVTVFDMGTRVPGGRACSRILKEDSKELAFDHGAQFIAPRPGSEFEMEVKEWVKAGFAAPWQGRLGYLDPKTLKFTPHSSDSSRSIDRTGTTDGFCGIASRSSRNDNSTGSVYVGVPHQGAIAQHLAAGLKTTTHKSKNSTDITIDSDTVLSGNETTPTPPPPTAPAPSILEGHPTDSKVKLGHKVTGLFYNEVEKLWTVEGVPRSASAATPASFGKFNAVIVADALVMLPDSAGYATGLVQEKERKEDTHEEVEHIVEQIRTIKHHPVFSLLVAFDTDSAKSNPGKKIEKERKGGIDFKIEEMLPFDGASLVSSENESESSDISSGFQWIARNSSKPGRVVENQNNNNDDSRGGGGGTGGDGGLSTWVAITTPKRARELLQSWPLHTPKGTYNPQTHEYRDAVAKELLGEFIGTLEKAAATANDASSNAAAAGSGENESKEREIDLRSRVVYYHAQRWGRGFVENPLKVDYLGSETALFAACGDFCGGGSSAGGGGSPIEAAWLSGQKAADAVASWLASSDNNSKL